MFGPQWENRTLITLHDEDVARMHDERLFAAGAALPEYRRVVKPSDLEDTELNDGSREAMERLRQALTTAGVDLTTIPPNQLKAAALSLGGHYGPEVTLSRLNPDLQGAMDGVIQQHYPDLEDTIRSTRENQSSLEFMIPDGHYSREDVHQMDVQSGYRGMEGRTMEGIEESFTRQLAEGKRTWARTYNRPVPFDQAQFDQAQQGAQQMDQQRETFGDKFKKTMKSIGKWFGKGWDSVKKGISKLGRRGDRNQDQGMDR
jgi:hypothetical protein